MIGLDIAIIFVSILLAIIVLLRLLKRILSLLAKLFVWAIGLTILLLFTFVTYSCREKIFIGALKTNLSPDFLTILLGALSHVGYFLYERMALTTLLYYYAPDSNKIYCGGISLAKHGTQQ